MLWCYYYQYCLICFGALFTAHPVYNVYFKGLDYLRRLLQDICDNKNKSSEDSNDASEEDDFFSSMAKRSSKKVTSELDCYLGMTSEEDISAFNSLPKLKKLFIKLNTPLPASAACERLFSTAGLIFSPKRTNIGSSSFENQLLLKLNAKLIQ